MLRYLLACGSVVSSLGVGALCAAPPWEMQHNLTVTEFEKASKEFAEKGYRVTQVSAAQVGKEKELRFLAVWEKHTDNLTWEARHDLTAKQYEKLAAELKEKGFHAIELCGYEADGEARFAAIWAKEPKGGPEREVRHALTSDDYRTLYTALSNKGYRPLRVSGYQVGKETRYATIWEKEPKGAPQWSTRRDLTADQYQEVFDDQLKGGSRVVHLAGYTIDGEQRFAGVWEKSPAPAAWQVRHRIDIKSFETQSAGFKSQSLRPVCVSVHAVNGQPQFVGMWLRE